MKEDGIEEKDWKDLMNKTFYLSGEHLDSIKELKNGLPNGIFYKYHTGLGATYTEFKANRNSIIVFPYIKLAWEKHQKYDSFYVGTRPSKEKVTEEEIADFIKEQEKGKNIKFCVVAESIEKVINGIIKAGQDPFKDYFLVLDEIEILQMQSGLRKSLPICFEYFLKFDNKCLVTATMLKFSNPEILKLDKYFIEVLYDKKQPLDVIRFKGEPHISLANKIIEDLQNPEYHKENYKILIGLNSTKAILQVISVFEKAGITDIAVLCGDSSLHNFDKSNTKEISKDGILPSVINIATSAYWNGIDINERFIGYAVTLNSEFHHRFSIENLIQFNGRCRKKKNYPTTLILPETLDFPKEKEVVSTQKRYEDFQNLLEYIDTNIESKLDKKNIQTALIESKGQLFYKNIKGKIEPNYLYFDFELYKEKTLNLFENNGDGFLNELIHHFDIDKKGVVTQSINFEADDDKIILEQKLPNFLSQLDENYSPFRLIDHIEKHWLSSIRVAAFWYLFGRKFFKDEKRAKELAVKFSENDKDCISISNCVLDGIRLAIYHNYEFMQFKELTVKGTNRKSNITGKEFTEAILPLKNHFPHIFTGKQISKNGSNFLKYFFNLEPKNIGGVNRFKIKSENDLIPFFADSKYALAVIESLNKNPKSKGGISKGHHNPEQVIQTNLNQGGVINNL